MMITIKNSLENKQDKRVCFRGDQVVNVILNTNPIIILAGFIVIIGVVLGIIMLIEVG